LQRVEVAAEVEIEVVSTLPERGAIHAMVGFALADVVSAGDSGNANAGVALSG
jgi:hypothetical protein